MVELSMVSGVGQPSAYAVVVLDEALRPRTADPEVRAEVNASLTQLLDDVNSTLNTHEQLQMLVVAREPWSIDNGCLTPTMKIKRSRIEAQVAPLLDAWFRAEGPVLWA
jgi:long-chain acyl-CoA synthetase